MKLDIIDTEQEDDIISLGELYKLYCDFCNIEEIFKDLQKNQIYIFER